MNTFFTADLHFDHANIIEYENRPFSSVEEMNQELIERWNNKVEKDSNVYILGDFCLTNRGERIKEILNQLNGNKFLVRGNHDKIVDKKWVREQFCWVKDYYKLNYCNFKIILFHYPILQWNGKHHNYLHFYGHVHSNIPEYSPLAYNVGVDVNNYEPLSFAEILNKIHLQNL